MKTKNITFFIATVFASISLAQAGVEYKTIRDGEDPITVDPTDLVEITAHGKYGEIRAAFSQNANDYIFLDMDLHTSAGPYPHKKGYIITGATSIYVWSGNTNPDPTGTWATLKITSKDDAAVPTQPSNVAVIPEDEDGQFEVIFESSTDLITWNPANAGTYGGTTTKRFFRTRIVKKATN